MATTEISSSRKASKRPVVAVETSSNVAVQGTDINPFAANKSIVETTSSGRKSSDAQSPHLSVMMEAKKNSLSLPDLEKTHLPAECQESEDSEWLWDAEWLSGPSLFYDIPAAHMTKVHEIEAQVGSLSEPEIITLLYSVIIRKSLLEQRNYIEMLFQADKFPERFKPDLPTQDEIQAKVNVLMTKLMAAQPMRMDIEILWFCRLLISLGSLDRIFILKCLVMSYSDLKSSAKRKGPSLLFGISPSRINFGELRKHFGDMNEPEKVTVIRTIITEKGSSQDQIHYLEMLFQAFTYLPASRPGCCEMHASNHDVDKIININEARKMQRITRSIAEAAKSAVADTAEPAEANPANSKNDDPQNGAWTQDEIQDKVNNKMKNIPKVDIDTERVFIWGLFYSLSSANRLFILKSLQMFCSAYKLKEKAASSTVDP